MGRRFGWLGSVAGVALVVGCECPPLADDDEPEPRPTGVLLIAGSVVDSSGTPVEDAVVRGWGFEASSGDDPCPGVMYGDVELARTDMAGRFRTRWVNPYRGGTHAGCLVLNVTPGWYSGLEIVVDTTRVTFFDSRDPRAMTDTARVMVVLPPER